MRPAEAGDLNPILQTTSLVGGSFSARDGYARPAAVVDAYRAAAAALGVQVFKDTGVVDVTTGATGIEEVHTNRGSIRTGELVCAAGAWSEAVGRMAGVALPVEPVRRQIGLTPGMFPTVPFTLDLSTTMYFHNYDRGLLLGISNPGEPVGFDRTYDDAWRPVVRQGGHDHRA